MRIVYSTESVNRNGGIHTVTIVKANTLANFAGNEIYIIVPHFNGPTPRPISPKVQLIDLGIKDFWVSILKQPKRNKLYKKLLQEALESIRPDIVVSTGQQDRNFLPRLKVSSNPVFIREIHFISNYRRIMATSMKERLLALWSEFRDYRLSINNYDQIVIFTEEDRKKNWRGNGKVTCMPNPLTITSNVRSNLSEKKAIAVGRLSYQKHFDALIKAWRIVADKYPDWELNIWGGNGPLFQDLSDLIIKLDLTQNVYLRGESPDISSKMAESSVIICTSLFEGMPLVLLEALSAGLPIVTFNYMYGAEEIVSEDENGYIVEEDDLDTLAARIITIISNEKQRKEMGEKALTAAQKFLPEVIASRWMDLFQALRQKKPGPLSKY